jgi:3-oxoacyl-[acyl-carrier-protein] synthase II
MHSANKVVITGIGAVLPGCDSRQDLWRQLSEGRSQLRLAEDPVGSGMPRPMGVIKDFDPRRYLGDFPDRHYRQAPAETQIYLAATVLARDDAKLDLSSVPAERVGLFDGTSRGSFAFWHQLIRQEGELAARQLYTRRQIVWCTPGQAVGIAAALLGVKGPAYTFTESCSSALVAIGHAFRELRDGEIDIAFAGGHEAALVAPVYAMYEDGGLLSDERRRPGEAVRPFGGGSGNAFGEGAVTLVMETRAHARRRGAPILATVEGFAYGNSGSHPARIDLGADRAKGVLKSLLSRSGCSAQEVGFVVGHGNGVRDSDASEIAYMRAVFGAPVPPVPLISVKPVYGHTLGAAGAVNAAAAALMLDHRRTIRTLNAGQPDAAPSPEFGTGDDLPAGRTCGIALSYGIGGHNSAVLLRRAEREIS